MTMILRGFAVVAALALSTQTASAAFMSFNLVSDVAGVATFDFVYNVGVDPGETVGVIDINANWDALANAAALPANITSAVWGAAPADPFLCITCFWFPSFAAGPSANGQVTGGGAGFLGDASGADGTFLNSFVVTYTGPASLFVNAAPGSNFSNAGGTLVNENPSGSLLLSVPEPSLLLLLGLGISGLAFVRRREV